MLGRVRELKRQVAVLSRLVEVGVTLNSTLEHEQLLATIIRTAAEVIDTEAASILLVDEHTRELRFAAATGTDPKVLAQIPVPMETSIAGAVFRENRPVIVHDVSRDNRHYGRVAEAVHLQVRSLLAVPMQIKGQVTGVLEAVNKRGGLFADDDAQVLSTFASQAAVAINNARLLDKLQRAYAELGKLDRMKSAFVTIASHELRTPLHTLVGYAELLDQELEGEVGEYARGVVASVLRMRRVIDELVNLRSLELGHVPLERERLDAGQLLGEVYRDALALAKAKSQRLIVEEPARRLLLHVDRRRILLVLTELVANAINFTPRDGEIRLRALAKPTEVWLQVEDNGAGIPAGEEEAIFRRFYQLEDPMTRHHGGLGVGLSIVREMVELHGGRVWAESGGIEKGSRFTVVLPLASD